jgi:hypothetical protein
LLNGWNAPPAPFLFTFVIVAFLGKSCKNQTQNKPSFILYHFPNSKGWWSLYYLFFRWIWELILQLDRSKPIRFLPVIVVIDVVVTFVSLIIILLSLFLMMIIIMIIIIFFLDMKL